MLYCFSLVFACTFCYSFSFTDVKPLLMPFVPMHRIIGNAACKSVSLNFCLKDLLFCEVLHDLVPRTRARSYDPFLCLSFGWTFPLVAILIITKSTFV